MVVAISRQESDGAHADLDFFREHGEHHRARGLGLNALDHREVGSPLPNPALGVRLADNFRNSSGVFSADWSFRSSPRDDDLSRYAQLETKGGLPPRFEEITS
jgi:hypothetical protein